MGVRHNRLWWVVQTVVESAANGRGIGRMSPRFTARAKRVSTYGGP
ncbi:hypothetical protein NJ7G_3406 [Natrinema sp. J7-2]|nr:hypothetical protein NJ7G_3406 [Natrinema sp. J7-2]